MPNLKMLTGLSGPEYTLSRGDEREFGEREASRLIRAGFAEATDGFEPIDEDAADAKAAAQAKADADAAVTAQADAEAAAAAQAETERKAKADADAAAAAAAPKKATTAPRKAPAAKKAKA